MDLRYRKVEDGVRLYYYINGEVEDSLSFDSIEQVEEYVKNIRERMKPHPIEVTLRRI